MDYNVLIIGSDANAYYMGRCYHEIFKEKAHVLAKSPLPYTEFSSILDITYNDGIWDEKKFIKALYKFKKEHGNKKTLLISSNETYANFIALNKEKLQKDGFIFNYPNAKLLKTLIMKEDFYKNYKDSCISIPETHYYDCSKETKFNKKMNYPVILKPSNVIMYNHIDFVGKNKIYKIESEEELLKIIDTIKENGYTDILIIQDFIPGDDSYLFDAVGYVDKNHQVKLLTLAQIGLQEHSKAMVGNAAVLINGYNEFGKTKEIEKQMKKFLEDIKYQGYCEFDLKYDRRDKKFKVLEINARQGRCSYYLDALGYNLVQVLIDDLIFNKKSEYKFLNKKVLLSFVPKGVAKKYIINDQFKEEMLSLWKTRVNPISYKKDRNLKRRIFLLRRHFSYYKDYKNGYWKVL